MSVLSLSQKVVPIGGVEMPEIPEENLENPHIPLEPQAMDQVRFHSV